MCTPSQEPVYYVTMNDILYVGRSTYEKAVDERDSQLEQTQRDASSEKQLRYD